MELTDFIYDFNLATTKTGKDVYEICSIINSGRKKEIEYKNCINLYEFVDLFRKYYIKYMKENEELKSLINILGQEVRYRFHTIYHNDISICFEILNPYPAIFDEKKAYVYFVNKDDNYYAYVNNGKNSFDKNYKNKKVHLNNQVIKSCCDIVRKHNYFLESFEDLKTKQIFGNGTTSVFTKIAGNVFEKISTFTLTFGNSYLSTTDFIEVKFQLDNNLKIIYPNSKVIMNDYDVTDIKKKTTIIHELLSSIYIHNDKLGNLYKYENNKFYSKKGVK